jgi:hypothetical protein
VTSAERQPGHDQHGDVVRHFLNAYVWWLLGDTSTSRQLAYFEGCQAALDAVSIDEPQDSAASPGRNELRAGAADCVTEFRGRQAAENIAAGREPVRAVVGMDE